MSAFELLSEQDKTAIEEYIANFGPTNSTTKSFAGVERVLQEWNKNKTLTLLRLFDNNLILRRPYTYKISKDGLLREFEKAKLNNPKYMKTLGEWAYRLVGGFLWNQLGGEYNSYEDFIYNVIDKHTLIDNAYTGDSFVFTFTDGTTFKVSKGMKPMRILHKLFEKTAPEFLVTHSEKTLPEDRRSFFDNLCIWHSQIFNQANIDGELCISIHPLDYMTMSDNDNGWDSCMTWMRETPGDYRAGTVEDLNSPYIIVAYLHNPEHGMGWDTSRWNSKRWRELFIINEHVISEIKGYPYQDENLVNTVLMWLKELAHDNLGWDYDNNEICYNEHIDYDEDKAFSVNFETTYHMYDDFGTLNSHRMRINKKKIADSLKDNKSSFYNYDDNCCSDGKIITRLYYPYGGRGTCMWCGGWLDEEEDKSSFVLCEQCCNTLKCACCGESLNNYTAVWLDDLDEPICTYCYENETSFDVLTDTCHLDDDCNWTSVHFGVEVDGEIILSDEYVLEVYDPEYNNGYSEIFSAKPKHKETRYAWNYTCYVTEDMIKDKELFFKFFNIRDEEEFAEILQELVDEAND